MKNTQNNSKDKTNKPFDKPPKNDSEKNSDLEKEESFNFIIDSCKKDTKDAELIGSPATHKRPARSWS